MILFTCSLQYIANLLCCMHFKCQIILAMIGSSERHETENLNKLADYHSWDVKEARGIPNVGSR